MIDAVAPSGESVALVADDMGRFTIEAATGTWTLRAGLPGTTLEIERRVDVAHTPVRLATLVLGDESLPQAAHRQAVDFDAVTDALITKMPVGPGGLEWTNLVIAENRLYHGAGYINNTVSGNYIGYNSSGYPVTIEHDIAFDFVGAWFGVAWPQAEGEVLEVRAWRGTQRVGEEAFELSALGPVWFDADYRGITRLELATRHYWQFVMDGPRFGFPD